MSHPGFVIKSHVGIIHCLSSMEDRTWLPKYNYHKVKSLMVEASFTLWVVSLALGAGITVGHELARNHDINAAHFHAKRYAPRGTIAR